MEYLVTGGGGFIGSNLVDALVQAGKQVRILDNFSTGHRENLEKSRSHVECIEGDLLDEETVRRSVAGVRVVFHLAALASVSRSVKDPIRTNAVNVHGTLALLQAAQAAGVERFVYSSSSSVYGMTPGLPRHEDMRPAPISPYAVQKLSGEFYVRMFHELYGLKTFMLRYFNVFGPRQDPNGPYAAVIPRFVQAFLRNEAPVIYGDGKQTRDFTFVEDVVRANLCAAEADPAAAGDVYNICGGRSIDLNELADLLARITGSERRPVYEAPRPGDVRDSEGDASRAKLRLGWVAGVGTEDGLRRTVAYFRGRS